jgi:hypothetical protein
MFCVNVSGEGKVKALKFNLHRVVVVGTLLPAAPAAHAVENGFHPAKSAAEMALDRVLKMADGDEFQLDNLLHRYPVVPKKQVDYRGMLTVKLIAAMQAEEHKLVAKDCGGRYLEGEICGMDYSPITCAQDTIAPYTYKTLTQRARDAIIAGPSATYRMIQVGSGWQIDGIKCTEGAAFNFR